MYISLFDRTKSSSVFFWMYSGVTDLGITAGTDRHNNILIKALENIFKYEGFPESKGRFFGIGQ